MVESAKKFLRKVDSHLRTNFRDSFFGEFTLFLGICNNWDHLLCTWQSLNDFSYFKIILQ